MLSRGIKALKPCAIQVSRRLEHYTAVGVARKPLTRASKCYKSGDHFIHGDLSYRGVVLYSWPGRVIKNGEIISEEKFYQVLVDQRDAEELPMEHELLRISDHDREKVDFSPTRFKNWDLVRHSEVRAYRPLDSGLAVKHHLIHHFLKSYYSYKDGVPTWDVRRTPTLNYWRKKFSSKPVICHESEVEFKSLADGENGSQEEADIVNISVIPYHLTTNNVSNINNIGHLTRFVCNSSQQYEVTERIILAENTVTGEVRESNLKMSIQLGGNFNSIYQHTRHVEIPHGDSKLMFIYRVQRAVDGKMKEISIHPFSVNSSPGDPDSDI